MKYLLPLLLFTVFLIPATQAAHAQQGTLSKLGQEIREFTQAASEKIENAGKKVEGLINNATTTQSNQAAGNFSQGINNTAAESSNAQQGTLSKLGQEIREFTQAASEKIENAGKKVEGLINNATTTQSNQTAGISAKASTTQQPNLFNH